jgi:hypothetical protein
MHACSSEYLECNSGRNSNKYQVELCPLFHSGLLVDDPLSIVYLQARKQIVESHVSKKSSHRIQYIAVGLRQV